MTTTNLKVHEYCPQTQVIFDLFHVLAKYGRELIDRVRVEEANRLREDKSERKLVKGACWFFLLLYNRKNLKLPVDHDWLEELLEANRALALVNVLHDDLKHL